MKAMVRRTYGPPDILRLEEVPKPTPGENGVLVRVHAAAANAGDWHLMRGTPFPFRFVAGLRVPKHTIIGTDVAGRVEAVGGRVTQFNPGDDVFGELSRAGFGGYAEYVVAPETALALKPSNASFEEAAATPTPGLTALQGLRKGKIHQGQQVLIHGAGGGVGTFAVQIAKSFGAHVTGVCSTRNVDLVRSLGADQVIDYTKQDFEQLPQRYDAIIDIPHFATHSVVECLHALAPKGVLVSSSNTRNRWIGGFSRVIPSLLLGPFVSQRVRAPEMAQRQADLVALAELVESGKVKPVIDRTYPLVAVPEAIRYFGEGHTRGKIVITV